MEIVRFSPASGTLAAGEEAASSLVIRSRDPRERTVWIGYSVQDASGRWHDVPAEPARVAGNAEATAVTLRWIVPADSPAGSYRVIMAVWDGRPGGPGATRLASADRMEAFRVVSSDPPIVFGGVTWRAGDHALGRGRVRPSALSTGDSLRLRLLPQSCDGAEIRTESRFELGSYTARLRTPYAPGSLTGFFLYEDVPLGNDEIDIEIHNDGTRRVLLSAWASGEMTNNVEKVLPFDPSAGHHSYTIVQRDGHVRFLADGALLDEFTSRLPVKAMKLMANVWWPTWLPCDGRSDGAELSMAEVQILP